MTILDAVKSFVQIDDKMWWSDSLEAYLFEHTSSLWTAWFLENTSNPEIEFDSKEEAVAYLLHRLPLP